MAQFERSVGKMKARRSNYRWIALVVFTGVWFGSQYGLIQLSAYVFGGHALALVPGSAVILLEWPQSATVGNPQFVLTKFDDIEFDGYNSRFLEKDDLDSNLFRRLFGTLRLRTIRGDPFTGASVVVRFPIFVLVSGSAFAAFLISNSLNDRGTEPDAAGQPATRPESK